MMMKAYQDQTTEKVQKTAFHQMEDADFLSDVGNGHDNTEQTEITEITMHIDSEQAALMRYTRQYSKLLPF